jgi:hypothetical protein
MKNQSPCAVVVPRFRSGSEADTFQPQPLDCFDQPFHQARQAVKFP